MASRRPPSTFYDHAPHDDTITTNSTTPADFDDDDDDAAANAKAATQSILAIRAQINDNDDGNDRGRQGGASIATPAHHQQQQKENSNKGSGGSGGGAAAHQTLFAGRHARDPSVLAEQQDDASTITLSLPPGRFPVPLSVPPDEDDGGAGDAASRLWRHLPEYALFPTLTSGGSGGGGGVGTSRSATPAASFLSRDDPASSGMPLPWPVTGAGDGGGGGEESGRRAPPELLPTTSASSSATAAPSLPRPPSRTSSSSKSQSANATRAQRVESSTTPGSLASSLPADVVAPPPPSSLFTYSLLQTPSGHGPHADAGLDGHDDRFASTPAAWDPGSWSSTWTSRSRRETKTAAAAVVTTSSSAAAARRRSASRSSLGTDDGGRVRQSTSSGLGSPTATGHDVKPLESTTVPTHGRTRRLDSTLSPRSSVVPSWPLPSATTSHDVSRQPPVVFSPAIVADTLRDSPASMPTPTIAFDTLKSTSGSKPKARSLPVDTAADTDQPAKGKRKLQSESSVSQALAADATFAVPRSPEQDAATTAALIRQDTASLWCAAMQLGIVDDVLAGLANDRQGAGADEADITQALREFWRVSRAVIPVMWQGHVSQQPNR